MNDKKSHSGFSESVKGLRLEHFKLQERSEFQVGRRIWFQFHYDNLLGEDVGYGSTGMAIHKWTGKEWVLHDYKHSYGGPNGRLRAGGGPGDGAFHDDNWKADEPGEFALTPYISFDRGAAHKITKLKQPATVGDVSHLAMPVYVTIKRDEPGAIHDEPPEPLFREQSEEVEVGEGAEIEEKAGGDAGAEQPSSPIQIDPVGTNELTRQVIEWHSGSGVRSVRIEFSRRDGEQWSVHTVINQTLDADNRLELIFLDGDEAG